jgi:cytochrome o ubiquinol oxidase subunit IV
MSYADENHRYEEYDTAPGDENRSGSEIATGVRGYLVGLGLSILLTVVSFSLPGTTLVWGPGIPVALVVLAIAQMGVHLVFFLHITTAPDNTNNAMALGFGVLIVVLLIGGSLWIMANLNDNMLPMNTINMLPMNTINMLPMNTIMDMQR